VAESNKLGAGDKRRTAQESRLTRPFSYPRLDLTHQGGDFYFNLELIKTQYDWKGKNRMKNKSFLSEIQNVLDGGTWAENIFLCIINKNKKKFLKLLNNPNPLIHYRKSLRRILSFV
jgi:hypothetical protein